MKSGTTQGFLLPDLHGNAVVVVNATETAGLAARRYDAYGQIIDTYDSGTGFNLPWRHQGRLDVSPDPANPLYEAGARYYSPGVGIFSQLDSVTGSAANPLTMNRYLYALANPATLVDPDGHAACLDVGTTCVPSVEGNNQLAKNKAVANRTRDASRTPAVDCGFAGLGCTPVGWLTGFAVGAGKSAIEIGGGIVVGTIGMTRDAAICSFASPLMPCSETETYQAIAGTVDTVATGLSTFAGDPAGSTQGFLRDAADWIGREHDLLTQQDAFAAGMEGGGILVGTEATGLSLIYGGKGAFSFGRRALGAEGAAMPGVTAGAESGARPILTRGEQVALNREAGDAWRDMIAMQFESMPNRMANIEVTKWTPFGRRVIDVEVSDIYGNVLGGIEAKFGNSPYKPLQQLKDAWLTYVRGYPVNLVRYPG